MYKNIYHEEKQNMLAYLNLMYAINYIIENRNDIHCIVNSYEKGMAAQLSSLTIELEMCYRCINSTALLISNLDYDRITVNSFNTEEIELILQTLNC